MTEKLTQLRINAALYRLEANMNQEMWQEDARVLSAAYRALDDELARLQQLVEKQRGVVRDFGDRRLIDLFAALDQPAEEQP